MRAKHSGELRIQNLGSYRRPYFVLSLHLSSWTEENKDNQELIIGKAKLIKLLSRTVVLHSGWALKLAVALLKPQILILHTKPTYSIRFMKTDSKRDTQMKQKFSMYVQKIYATFIVWHKQKGYSFG